MLVSPSGAEIWRDYETDGVPSSGNKKPKKSEIRRWANAIEQLLSSVTSAAAIFPSRSALFETLTYPANTLAWVVSDATAAFNGVYRKSGASGSGSWTRVTDLPFSFIVASNTGSGAPNALQAATSIPVSESALVIANVYEVNTAAPVTISFNGGAPLTIKSNSGNDIAPGGLTPGMLLLGYVSGTTFRLVTDQVSSAVVAQAEAAAVQAGNARDAALSAVPNTFPATRSALKSLNTSTLTSAYLREAGREGQFVWMSGDYSAQITADTTEAVYIKANTVAATAGAWVRVFDGLAVSSRWFGNDWQAAIDFAAFAGIATVNVSGTYTATSVTGALKMRPGITLHNFAGTAVATQGSGQNVGSIVDFATYAAVGARLLGVVVDGNRSNNTDEPPQTISKQLILIYDTNDVTVQRCTIKNGNGNGIIVRHSTRFTIDSNTFTNMLGIPVAVVAITKGNYYGKITNNDISGDWGQDAIVVRYSNFCIVRGNKITGIQGSGGTFTINIASGNTVTSQSGNYFSPASKGKFLIYSAGGVYNIEKLIVSYIDPTTVVIQGSTPNVTGGTAVWGNGDVISVQGADDCDISENIVIGSASLGISIFSDNVQSANRNRISRNRLAGHGSAGISLQNVGSTFVLGTIIEGNNVVDCGLNRTAGDNAYNVGISCRGGANTQRVTVVGNSIEGYLGTPTMDYGIAFDSSVGVKTNAGNIINGTVGGKTIQNP